MKEQLKRTVFGLAAGAALLLSTSAAFAEDDEALVSFKTLSPATALELAQAAFETACTLLRPGGAFVVKVFDGQEAHAYIQGVRTRFTKIKRLKPPATRNESVEFFAVATGFKPEG